jgi:hypothetical protein
MRQLHTARSLVTAALVLAAAVPALALSTLTTVHFAAGQSSAKLEGSLVRGDSAIYSFSASAGQIADISITSLENNAGFTIYQPPAQVSRSDTGVDIDGSTLQLDGRQWSGKLPASGDYYVEVGGDRGNATYTLTIAVE